MCLEVRRKKRGQQCAQDCGEERSGLGPGSGQALGRERARERGEEDASHPPRPSPVYAVPHHHHPALPPAQDSGDYIELVDEQSRGAVSIAAPSLPTPQPAFPLPQPCGPTPLHSRPGTQGGCPEPGTEALAPAATPDRGMGAPSMLGRGVQGTNFDPPVSPLSLGVGAGWEEGVVSEGEGVPSKTRGPMAWAEGRVKRFSAPPSRGYPDPSKPPHGLEEGDGHLSDGSTKKVKTAQSFESLFDSENLSDVLLSVNGGQFVFHAHKMILGLKSERLTELIRSLPHPSGQAPGEKPVLQLEVAPECSLVFSRFLYFIYSGAVWLHRDYVIPLYQLADKFEVRSLLSHCESYILQLLVNPAGASGEGSRELPVETVCDLCEGEHSSDAIRSTAFSVLCGRFRELASSDRWVRCGWQLVSDLLRSNECAAEENLILASSTDWMKRNNLQDKKRIETILSSIRYPLLNRRVLYHIQKNAAFRNFPCVEELVNTAIRYHCFKDLPEAKHDFHGTQFTPRQLPCPGQDPRPLSSVSTSEETLAMCSSAVQPYALRQQPTPPPN